MGDNSSANRTMKPVSLAFLLFVTFVNIVDAANIVNPCLPGQWFDGSTCQTCPSGCDTCTDPFHCQSCSSGLILNNIGPESFCCTALCSDTLQNICSTQGGDCGGCYLNSDGSPPNCQCPGGTFPNTASSTCTPCTEFDPSCLTCTSSTCTSCLNDYFLSAGTCVSCIANCYSCSSESTCDSCSPGYFMDTGGCEPCPAGTYQNLPGSTSCNPCPNFSSSPLASTTSDKCTCITGYYLDDSLGGCQPCSTNPGCLACETYNGFNGNAEQCDSCDVNYYMLPGNREVGSLCSPCPTNSESPGGTVSECTCISGYAGYPNCQPACDPVTTCSGLGVCDSTGNCVCDAGASLLFGTCYQCSETTYKPSTGNDPCQQCPDGFGSDTGATECYPCQTDCLQCVNNAQTCLDCDNNGNYLDVNTQQCVSCSTISPGCISCAESATPKGGLPFGTCDTCDVNYYLVIGTSTTPTVCSPCPSNSESPGGSVEMCTCISGYQLDQNGNCQPLCDPTTTCSGNGVCNTDGTCSCNQGYAGSDCGQCDTNYYLYPDCIFCMADSTCNGHGTCGNGLQTRRNRLASKLGLKIFILRVCTCNTGYAGVFCNQCDTGYVGYPNCVPCDPSITCSGNGVCNPDGSCSCNTAYEGTSCSSCAPGYHFDTNGLCVPCPAGSASAPGSTVCTQCLPGTFSASGASSCSLCSGGEYSNAYGASACSTCPTGASGTTYIESEDDEDNQEDESRDSGDEEERGDEMEKNDNNDNNDSTGTTSPSGGNIGCACLPGFYGRNATVECFPCPAGTYSNKSNAESHGECKKCHKGSISSSPASTSCSLCTESTYASGESLTTCSQCPIGGVPHAFPQGGNDGCNCQNGYYNNAGTCKRCIIRKICHNG